MRISNATKILVVKAQAKLTVIAIAIVICGMNLSFLCLSASAETRTGLVGTTSVVWTLTPEQTSKVDPMLAELEIKNQNITRQIVATRHQMDKLFMDPSPDRKAILALQSHIDKDLEELRLDQWKVAFNVRSMLSPEQRRAFGCLNPQDILSGIELSPAQTETYYRFMRPYLVTSLSNAKKLTLLHLDQAILMQEMDLVHGCHTMKLDMPALMKNQDQVNDLESAKAMERLRVAIALHDMLTPEQRTKIVRGEAEIRIPDPLGVLLAKETAKSVPSAEKVFPHITPTKEQVAQYNAIMKKEVELTEAYKKMRNTLLLGRMRMISAPQIDLTELESIQEKINKIDAVNGSERVIEVAKVRDILTPEQRHLVFNRHHPKIWKDTGINEKQDEEIMAIHMKIEEADRAGKKKMASASADMTRLYYVTGNNDEEILAAQREYNKAQSDMVVAQLDGLFAGRDALNDAQRHKLVQLMQANQAAATH